MNSEDKKSIFGKNWLLIIIILGLCILFLGSYFLYIAIKYQSCTKEINNLSALGQYLSGSLGLLLTFATIIGLAMAFLAQKKQIEIQTNEIKVNEINNQITAFENKFFQLLNLLQNIVNNTEISDSKVETKGSFGSGFSQEKIYFVLKSKKAFEKLSMIWINDFLNKAETFPKIYNEVTLEKKLELNDKNTIHFRQSLSEKLSPIFIKFLNDNSASLPHYFRTVYHILKLIHIKKIEIASLDSKFYSNILRAQISDDELKLIFFNSICQISNYNSVELNFKKLIEEYQFFEHLDKQFFKNFPLIINMYENTAYSK